jgi:hypothetical protein
VQFPTKWQVDEARKTYRRNVHIFSCQESERHPNTGAKARGMLIVFCAASILTIHFAANPCILRAQGVVCRKERLSGFDFEQEMAKQLLGADTRKLTEAKIFITAHKDHLFAQTNYVCPGYESPAKLAADSELELPDIALNLLYDHDTTTDSKFNAAEFVRLVHDQVSFFIDRDAIDKSSFPGIDLSKCRHLTWVKGPPKGVDRPRKAIDLEAESRKPGNSALNAIQQPTSEHELSVGAGASEDRLWEGFAAFAFGVAFVIAIVVLAIKLPNPTHFQYSVFRVILAIAAAGVGAMIPGFLSLSITSSAGLVVRAAGALGVFVVVYFFNPAKYAIQANGASNSGVGIEPNAHHQEAEKRTPFSLKESQEFQLRHRLLGADRSMYHFELSDTMVGENSVKFTLRVYKHVVGRAAEKVRDEAHGLSVGEGLVVSLPWQLVLEKVERRRAYFHISQ